MKTSHRHNLPFERGSSHRALLLLVAAAVAIATAPGIVKADILYDTTDMTDNETYDSFGINVIGGEAFGFGSLDVQCSDDFNLGDAFDITRVTADMVNFTSSGLTPAGGVLVEFFTDLAGTPSETPFAAVLATGSLVAATAFSDHTGSGQGVRLEVDLSSAGITLGPGTWWLSMTAVDETPTVGDLYAQVKTNALFIAREMHFRDGGLDHGNGYDGLLGCPDWCPGSQINEFGTYAMKIEGTPVKPDCPWDIDGSGDVGVKDLLILLGAWGPCPPKGECPADFDASNDVGVKDLLVLLGVWGPCP